MAKVMTAIRIDAGDLKRIDAEARRRGITRTDLLVRGALGELEQPPDRLADIERRLTALERNTAPAREPAHQNGREPAVAGPPQRSAVLPPG